MTAPTLLLTPLQAAVPAAGGTLDLLVRLRAPQAPSQDAPPAAPKRLVLVVDRSGSMSGEPLREALRCVEHIASHLSAQDQLSLVVYDHQVQVLLPLQPMPGMDVVRRVLMGVDSGGSTDLHGGWLQGAQELEGGVQGAVSRVILLSDGQANHGLTDSQAIETQCRDWLARGVSTTTVGLGRGFNEELMIGMARAGGGQNYYGQTAADLYDNFDEELALIQALCLRQVALKLIPAPGVVVEMLSPAVALPDGSWRMNELAWGAESWLAVRLHLSPSASGALRDLLAASVTAQTVEGMASTVTAPLLQLPALEPGALAALPRDDTAHNRLEELAFVQAAEALQALLREGDTAATTRALQALEQRFGDHPWLRAKIDRLRQLAKEDQVLMAKEVRYSRSRMSQRLAPLEELAFCMDETESQEMPAFLRKKVSEGQGKRGRG